MTRSDYMFGTIEFVGDKETVEKVMKDASTGTGPFEDMLKNTGDYDFNFSACAIKPKPDIYEQGLFVSHIDYTNDDATSPEAMFYSVINSYGDSLIWRINDMIDAEKSSKRMQIKRAVIIKKREVMFETELRFAESDFFEYDDNDEIILEDEGEKDAYQRMIEERENDTEDLILKYYSFRKFMLSGKPKMYWTLFVTSKNKSYRFSLGERKVNTDLQEGPTFKSKKDLWEAVDKEIKEKYKEGYKEVVNIYNDTYLNVKNFRKAKK
jgi:hypothetical protein